jgi:XRE family transcriptional regulator, regulator of sulfur utilization
MSDSQDVPREFGAAIRRIRLRQNVSQERLAGEAELDRSYVGAVERGERNPSLKVIKKLADALGVSLSTLFSECEAGAKAGDRHGKHRRVRSV